MLKTITDHRVYRWTETKFQRVRNFVWDLLHGYI